MYLLALLYGLVTASLGLYGLNSLLLTITCLLHRRADRVALPVVDRWPRVTVQLPVYNELHVAERLINAVMAMDYPPELLQVQVLDDSTDSTSKVIGLCVARHVSRGANIGVLRRTERRGFKAGALKAALPHATGEFVAVLDADFVPPVDFLRCLLPRFADLDVGCVQARWDHLNRDFSVLTQLQALAIDGHFAVEQRARSQLGLFLNFNGSAGVWRRACIEQAGGWQSDTLAEDLDLSYRAQLQGWRIVYEPGVRTPAELPPQFEAMRRQQARWAQGSIQVAMKLIPLLVRSAQPLGVKLEGLAHLTGYLMHPLLLAALLLGTPLVWLRGPGTDLLPHFVLVTMAPSLLYVVAQSAEGGGWLSRVRFAPLLVLLGVGLAWSNTLAVGRALLGHQSEFSRTPKFGMQDGGRSWKGSAYRLHLPKAIWGEALLSVGAGAMAVVAVWLGRASAAWWLTLYAMGFGGVVLLSLLQAGWPRYQAARFRMQERSSRAFRPPRAGVASPADASTSAERRTRPATQR